MYFTIMNIICFGTIGYLLSENNISYRDYTFFAIFALVIIIQLLPIVCFIMVDEDT